MAVTENIGSVSVLIGGDYSPLVASFGQVQGVAQRAGSAVASAFNSGAKQAPGLVDQFGRAIQSAGSAAATATPQVAGLGAQTTALAAGATRAANALAGQAAATHGAVTEIQAASAAIRVFEGNQAIRAVERFVTSFAGVGAVLQAAFPIVGSIALTEVLFRMGEAAYKAAQNFLFMKEATEASNKVAIGFAREAEASLAHLSAFEADALEKHGRYVEAAQKRQQTLMSTPIHMPDLLDNKEIKSAIDGFTNHPAWNNLKNLFSDVIPADIPDRINAINAALKPIETEMAAIKRNGFDPTGLSQHFFAQDTLEANLYAQALEFLKIKQQEFAQHTAVAGNAGTEKEAEAKTKGAVAQIQAAEEANARVTAINKQQIEIDTTIERQRAQIQIDAMSSSAARAVAGADADVKIARERREKLLLEADLEREAKITNSQQIAAAELGTARTPLERGTAALEGLKREEAAHAEYAKTALELDAKVTESDNRALEARSTAAREFAAEAIKDFGKVDDYWDKLQQHITLSVEKQLETQRKVFEIQDRSAGENAALAIQKQKLLLEREFGLEVFHTQEERLSYLQRIAALEEKERQAKITGFRNALGELPEDTPDSSGKNSEERARLEGEIAKLQAQAANAQVVATTKELELRQQINLQFQIQSSLAKAVSAAPGAIGGGLAAGIFQHGQGTSIGQEISKALKGIGQQLLGSIFQQLITKFAIQAAIQAGLITVTTANTAATTANATITGVHAGVMVTHTVAMVAHLAVMIANTASTIANTIATLIQAALSMFGFADGGSPPVGVPSIVGERGPEVFVPHGAGTIIPNHMLKGYAEGAGLDALPQLSASGSTNNSASFGDMHFHAHGVSNPRQHAEMAIKEIPKVLKSRGARWSPYSS